MTTRSLKRVILVLTLGTFVSIGTGLAAAQNPQRLVGSWRIQVTLQDCNSGAPLGPAFNSLATFASGGTTTDTTANPMFFPAERSPGHGVWSRTGGRSYQASSTAFLTVNGVLAKTQVITQKIRFGDSPDEYTSAAQVQFFDPAGTLMTTACATASAQRLK